MKKGIIIGAGIGGLTTAIALAQKGIDVTVYEQAPEIKAVGAGIWMASNALKIFEKLGFEDEVINSGMELLDINVIDTNNKLISKIDTLRVKQKHKFGTIAIHRSDLHKILASKISKDKLITNKHFTSFIQENGKVKAFFEDGTSVTADFMINADGIKSKAREQLFTPLNLRYSGQTCWRFVTDFQLDKSQKNTMYEIWANSKGLRVGYSQINDKEIYCYITNFVDAGIKDNKDTLTYDLLEMCKEFQPIVKELIRSVDPEKIIRSDISDFKPIKKWVDGNVALLGDAAHATTPNLGQGACQGVEDAFSIAEELSKTDDTSSGFLNYQKNRIEKATFITNTSWQFAQITNTSGFKKEIVKNLIKLTPNFINDRQLDKIYDVDF